VVGFDANTFEGKPTSRSPPSSNKPAYNAKWITELNQER